MFAAFLHSEFSANNLRPRYLIYHTSKVSSLFTLFTHLFTHLFYLRSLNIPVVSESDYFVPNVTRDVKSREHREHAHAILSSIF